MDDLQSEIDYDSLLSLCIDPDGEDEKSICTDEEVIVHQYDQCTCGGKMFKNDSALQCSMCPIMKPFINDEVTRFGPATSQYNSGSSPYCKITGKSGGRAHAYQRNLYPITSPEDRERKMFEHAMSKLNAFNSTEAHNIRFPTHFLRESATMLTCIQIANDRTLKDTVYVGALIRCLAIVCKKHKLYQKGQSFCTFANINQTNLTQRNKLIRDMLDNGVIEYKKYYNPEESLFTQYFTMFNIPMKYKEFAHDLIKEAVPRNMRGDNNNTIDSKCAAVIAILQKKLEMSFTSDDICKKCEIVQSTYEKFCRYAVANRDLLMPIFEKHGIPRLTSKDFQKKVHKKKTVKETPKRGRGRPPGVKNKQTVAIVK